MAEGWASALHPSRLAASSAGTHPHAINPLAIRAMAEVGIDISSHQSKHIDAVSAVPFDAVITVCEDAHESCPILPGARTIHRPFDDPPRLAKDAAGDDEAMSHYRRVRDEIRRFIESLPTILSATTQPAPPTFPHPLTPGA